MTGPFAPEEQKPGGLIKAADWNAAMEEVVRLESAKVNRQGADTLEGPLTIRGALTLANSVNIVADPQNADTKLAVTGNITLEINGSAKIATKDTTGKGLDVSGTSRLGGGHDYQDDTVLSVAPGTIHFDAPGIVGGRLTILGDSGTTAGNIGIGNAAPLSKLTINQKIAHDGGFSTFGEAALTIFDPNHNGGNNPNGIRDILHLVREGVNGQAYGNKVSLALGRYENAGTASRTQLDIKLTDNKFNSHKTILSLKSNGTLTVSDKGTITCPGRLHISGEEILYLLNKNGVTIGKEWGGTGNLVVQGDVGIATTSLSEKLQISDFTSAADNYMKISTAGGNRFRAGIKLKVYNDNFGFTIENDERPRSLGLNVLRHSSDATGKTALFIAQGTGDIGMGTSTPAAKLHIKQTGNSSGIRLDEHGSDRYFRIAYEGQGNIHFYHKNSQGQWMDPNGHWHHNSDLALKKDITGLKGILDKVIQLKPVHFRWRNSNNQDIGFIAQDIEEIFPEFVSSVNCNNQKIKGIAYSSFSVLAISAIQEMKQYYDAQIESLKRQISNLS
ncbi:tail fiber domain-containing protein [Adonisia turfae]|uniref:Tail fiber domain-containing protein n=1 Tax=Adonisia turfae CCMR0081 TaxID=2292702 RepID=A0A6M0RYC0_9CYAN|nr:tail fiber domain-containing protein [Adonisia turfae]NEZ61146.1 tail fiber domain-containing protein [Adonisia turfae CCMR0081]